MPPKAASHCQENINEILTVIWILKGKEKTPLFLIIKYLLELRKKVTQMFQTNKKTLFEGIPVKILLFSQLAARLKEFWVHALEGLWLILSRHMQPSSICLLGDIT